MVIVFGAIISVAALVDPQHKRSGPSFGFTLFLAPLCALMLSIAPGLLPDAVLNRLGEFGLLGAYFSGLIGGCV